LRYLKKIFYNSVAELRLIIRGVSIFRGLKERNVWGILLSIKNMGRDTMSSLIMLGLLIVLKRKNSIYDF
ncbi:hypothetical protein DW665_21560, partial [Parabacteroides sp. AM25-14]|uniref:hypothetical protein n=1 Tax=Parabacteroides sp. AM25-14 TaxID=2293120 RepID=UPI000E9E69F9